MNRLLVALAALLAVLVISRRKTLKEDTERVKVAATDQAAKLNVRVRGQSSDEDVVDLVDEVVEEATSTDAD